MQSYIKTKRAYHYLAFILITLMFLFLSSLNIKYIETDDEETSPATWSIYLQYNKDLPLASTTTELFDIKVPLNYAVDYCFALMDYMLHIVFLIFGTSLTTLRILPIISTVLSLFFLYEILSYFFNKKTAYITLLLLTTSPFFIYYSVRGVFAIEPFLNMFFWGAIYFFIKHRRHNRYIYLHISSFLLGLGLSLKISVFSRFFGLLVAFFIVFRKKSSLIFKKYKKFQIFISLLFFLMGATLFIYYNLVNSGATFKLINRLYSHTETNELNNNSLISNIEIRLRQLKIQIQERAYSKSIFLLYIFYITFVFNLIYALFLEKNMRLRNTVIYIYILYCSMFFSSFFSPGSISIFHLSLLYPFPQLCIALACFNIDNFQSVLINRRNRIFILIAVFITLIYILTIQLISFRNYHFYIKQTSLTQQKISLSKFIEQHKLQPIYILADRLDNLLILETKGQVVPPDQENRIYFMNKYNFEKALKEILHNNNIVYFVEEICPENKHIEWLQQYIANKHKKITVLKKFYTSKQEPLYRIYKIE